MMKEGGSLGIDTIGNLPIDEDLDLLAETVYSATIGLAMMGQSAFGNNTTVVSGTQA
tara:strand:- start:129 stop:299 length:171 start_codon:yes stop_codon:yes gene_type:complete